VFELSPCRFAIRFWFRFPLQKFIVWGLADPLLDGWMDGWTDGWKWPLDCRSLAVFGSVFGLSGFFASLLLLVLFARSLSSSLGIAVSFQIVR